MRSVIILFIIGFLVISCENKIEEKKTDEQVEQMLEKFKKNVKPDAEKVILLSMKYNIEVTKAENILDEYLSKYDSLYMLMKGIFERGERRDGFKQEIQATLNELSIKYDIPKEILAGIIIDYKIWAECSKVEL